MKYDLNKSVIAPFWQKVIDDIKENLILKKKSNSGNTLQAIEAPRIQVGDNTYNIELYMPDYYAYLDEGVRGIKNKRRNTGRFFYKNKMPPLVAIRQFMKNSAINGDTKRGKRGLGGAAGPFMDKETMNNQEKLNKIAWAIARSIYNNGLEQTDFYSDVVNDKLFNNFADQILEELGKDIIVNFKIQT